MTEQMPDLTNKKFMCHVKGTIHSEDAPVKIFYRNDDIVTVFPTEKEAKLYKERNPQEKVSSDTDYKIDLTEIRGMICKDYRISFHLLDQDKVDEYQHHSNGEWYHSLYHFINYEISDWAEVREHNELEFYDAIYSDDE